MRGYAHRPEATAESIDADGWFHSGDVGILDEDGYLSIVDRTKDMLLYKGYNVFPRELEEILFGVPGVAGAAVVGRPDEEAGELPVAYVVRKADDAGAALTAESVMAAVNDKVTPYKRLRDVVFIDAIPVSAAGKVLKRELAAKEREKVGLTARRRLTRSGAAARAVGRSVSSAGWSTGTSAPRPSTPASTSPTTSPRPSARSGAGCCSPSSCSRSPSRVIYADRDGYRDGDSVGLSLLDSAYYATVTLSTTGYGDITPITAGARLVNILLITPLRITFLLVLIGTTLEALTARSREEFRIRRWRSRVRQHVIVCGYGTKGRSAIRSLQALGTPLDKIVVVDPDPRAIDEANSLGLTGIVGDAGRTEVLRRASVERARAVIVAANRDDAAVLITLTVRQLNPTVPITTSVREEENANLLRQSGADTVITTSATSGRLLGLSTDAPRVVAVVEDLVTGGQGLDLHQRTVDLQRGRTRPAVAARHRPVGHPRRPDAALRRPADRRTPDRRRPRRRP